MTQTSTKITYIFEGKTKHGGGYEIRVDSKEQEKLDLILQTGKFIWHMDEMWSEKGTRKDPGYDLVCTVTKITKYTEIITRKWEDFDPETEFVGLA